MMAPDTKGILDGVLCTGTHRIVGLDLELQLLVDEQRAQG